MTQRLKFLVALRPGIISPTVAARQAATLDRLSGGRALFNLVTGGDPEELAGDGLFLTPEVVAAQQKIADSFYQLKLCLLYTSPSPRDGLLSRMPSSA